MASYVSPPLHNDNLKDHLTYRLRFIIAQNAFVFCPPTPTMTKLLHLQGIRGVAICSVIAFHFFPDYFPNGYLGVDLFFVLSGYLMSMMLSRHPNLTLPLVGEFLYRRVKRIVPLYYLIIIISTSIIYLCPCSEILTNMTSSKRAITLTTNLYFDNADDYFKKLGVSHDLFTHTWSLCLELQFYLLFPILWWMQTKLGGTRRMVLLHIISGASLYFYFVSDEKRAFNNMFCRIWQFLFGNMIFCLEVHNSETKGTEKIPLLEEEEEAIIEQSEDTTDWIFASLSLVLLAYSTVTEQHLTANYARMTTTVVSIILIYFGKKFYVLENGLMVFLGEISYAWYLVHWPLLTVLKIFERTTTLDLFLGILLSFVVAVVIHYGLERYYLGWEKLLISIVVCALLAGCFATHFILTKTRLQECGYITLRTDYAIMTIEERKEYNAELIANDRNQLVDNRCIFEQPRTLEGMEGTCKYRNPTSNNNRTIAIIGNSWAANSSPLLFDECSPYFGQIYRSAAVACEAFQTANNTGCLPRQKMYFEMVERVKPDYLFIVVRYCYMMEIYSDKEWEETVKDGKERLALLSQHVKEKIFVIHTFPATVVYQNYLTDAMEKGTPIDWSFKKRPIDMAKAQEKLDEIVSSCSKCEQFDYTPQFMINGTLYPYEPHYFIALYGSASSQLLILFSSITLMGKLPHLQGIRGVAICFVIAFHFFPDYFPNGYLGVDLFFVLSGYLMSMMLSQHSNLTLPIFAEFLYRRVKRIFPLYYLIILISTVSLYFCPCSEVLTNLVSFKRAIILATNLYFDSGDDYFQKLGISHDLFTHTWSLCLELQFYLLFPCVWWMQTQFGGTKRLLLLHAICVGSLLFYFLSSENRAFSNMFCRIWQFLFGNIAFCLEQNKKENEGTTNSSNWIFASLSLFLLAYSTITELSLPANYARMATTVVSISLISFGKGFCVLENNLLRFLGKISYAWYLVHWRILTIFKIFELTKTLDMLLGILLSFVAAIAFHYTVEKYYLSWEKPFIFAAVCALLLGSLGVYFALNKTRLEECAGDNILRTDYVNMTIDERKKYNAKLIDHDHMQLIDERCIFEQPRMFEGMEGTCKYANAISKNNRTIAIIGNSWAANSSPLLFEECSPYFGQIYRSAAAGCEVFKTANNSKCLPKQKMYFEMVERIKPDYLFIVVRYLFMMRIFTKEEWMDTVKDGKEVLQ